MKLSSKLFLTLCLTSCASLSNQPAKTIAFSDIEKLELGRTTKDQVLALFGKPNEILPHSKAEEAWIYDGTLNTGAIAQKASFSFKDNNLIGAFWVPYDSDALQNIAAVQKHFKDAKFARKVKGWDPQGHSYSDDVRYYDVEKGISYTTDADKIVTWITLTMPSTMRNVSSETVSK